MKVSVEGKVTTWDTKDVSLTRVSSSKALGNTMYFKFIRWKGGVDGFNITGYNVEATPENIDALKAALALAGPKCKAKWVLFTFKCGKTIDLRK